jgi:hypothetical protein
MDVNEIRRRNLWSIVHPYGYSDQGVKSFADKTGKSEQRIRHLIAKSPDTDAVKNIGTASAREFERLLKINSAWLDHPHEESWGGKLDATDKKACNADFTIVNNYGDKNYVEIKQHTDVTGSMGHGSMLSDNQEESITSWQVTMEWANRNIPSNTGIENLRIVTGKGDSMKGMFNDGDPIIVDVGVNNVAYDAVYFFRIGDRGYIKRLQGMPDGSILAISKNNEYRDMVITDDLDCQVFGRVLKVWQGESF